MRASKAILAVALLALAATEARGETAQERGAYLVNVAAACGLCHTPRDAANEPNAAMALAGGFEFDAEALGHIVMPNITPDAQTGIGAWSQEQIVTALRNGKRPDGTIIALPMPIPEYRGLSDRDAEAIAAYLKSLPAIRHAVNRSQLKISLPASYGPIVDHVAEPDRGNKIAYGAYLTGPVAHCVFCHTPPAKGKPIDMSRAFGGGRELADTGHPGALTIGRNITSDPDDGIGRWTDEDIRRAITACVRPDATRLSRTMPCEWFVHMAPDDLDAIVAFLRTVPPVKSQPN